MPLCTNILSFHICKQLPGSAGGVASVGQRVFETEGVHRLMTLQGA